MKDSLPYPKSFASIAVSGLLLISFGADRVSAATNDLWSGGGAPDGNWQNAANWGGIAPQALDALFFDGAVQTSTTNNFAAGTIFGNIAFNSTADAFTLNGNSVALYAFTNGIDSSTVNPVSGNITNSSFSTETINLPLTLPPGRHTFSTVGGGQLNINGAVTRSVGATVVFSPLAGNINVTGAFATNGFNNILGGWATIGVDWATLDADSNVVAYTGYVDISAGAIANDPTSNVRYIGDSANITSPSGTRINSLLTQQGAARSLTVTNTLKLGPKGGIYRLGVGVMTITGGTITADGGGELTFYDSPFNAAGGNNINIVSAISNDGPNAVTVNIMGYVQYGQAAGAFNNYSGGTYINQGRVQITPVAGFGTGPVYVYPSGEILFNSNGTYTNNFFIGGVGTPESGGLGALRMGGAARIISGRVTLMGDANIANNGRISGQITGNGELSIGHGSSANGHGVIQVGGAVANDYTGNTIINGTASQAADTLQIFAGFNDIMPHGAGKGNVVLNAGSATASATFDLNGTTQTINALVNTPNSPANDFVTSSTAGGLLIVGDNNATSTFAGRIQNAVGLTKIGAGILTLTGANTYTNPTTVNGGSLVLGLGAFSANSPLFAVNSNATIDVTAICPLTLGAAQALSMSNGTVILVPQSTGNAITTPTLTASGSTNRVTVTAIPAIAAYPAQFTLIKYTTLNGSLNFGLGGALPVSPGLPYVGFISNNTVNGSVDLVITAGPATVRWTGYSSGAPNSAWDIATTANWRTLGGAPTTYSDGSFALFDDTASNGVVTLSQTVTPAGITVTNSALAYTINDFSGSLIAGVGSLAKQGNGTLILDNLGVNTFSGGVTISAGTLQVGNNDTGGNLPTGNVGNNGALVFNRVDEVTVPNGISGTGTLTQNGSGGLTLSGVNTFTGAVTVAQGTLRLGNSAALGTTNGGTVVSSGATLDIVANNINIGQEQVTASGIGVSGAGAIVNNSGSPTFSQANIARLTLAGDTTVGGTGRWDLRANPTSNPNLASLSTGGNPRKLTKVGANQVSLVGITVDDKLGDIDVQAGIFSVEAATTGIGNVASNLTVASGATFQMFAPTNLLNKKFVINDGGSVVNSSGASTIIGPMALTNSSVSAAPYCTFNVGGTSLMLSNVLTGDAILYKLTGTAPLTLAGNSPAFAGGVLLNNGTITLSGTLSNNLGVSMVSGTRFVLTGTLLGAPLTNAFNSTLVASGTSGGLVDVSGNLLTGEAGVPATFTAGGLILEDGANLTNDLGSFTTPGGGTNDLIVVNGDLVINSANTTININPIGLLQTGVKYRLINYSGSLITNAHPTVPTRDNYTFTLDFSTTNQVNVIAIGGPPVWNGGSATASTWTDTNNWNGATIVSGDNLYFNGNTRVNNTNDTIAGTAYNDLVFTPAAGLFVLNGNPITLGGSIINNSTNAEVIKLGVSFSANRTLNGASGPLIIGGGVTNASNLSTLTLAGTGILTNLMDSADPNSLTNIISVVSNANWTLVNNPSSTQIVTPVQLDMLAGTFNFGQGANAPDLSSTASANNSRVGVTANAPATFNMVNGTLTLSARLNTGAAGNSIATVNQTGGTLNVTLFQNADGSAASHCTVNLTGGTLNVGVPTRTTFFVSSRGTGVVSVATSGVLNCGVLDVSRGISSSTPSSVSLNTGGLISATRVGTASSASVATSTNNTATFNFNGGRLQAAASSTTYFQGNTASPAIPITAIVKSGGAIIDTTNFNISVLEPLLHDSTLGATPDGGLIKHGSGRLTLASVSTYTGATVVSNGTLAVNGTLGLTPVIVATNGTLGGTGTCGSNVTVQAGGTIAPGNSAGTLTVSSSVNLQGIALMEIQKSANTNDRVRSVLGAINYGGTLVVTNIGGTLVGGESFKLFDSGINSYVGTFGTMQLAPLGTGLSWNTTQLGVSGTISVSGTIIPPTINSTVQSGTDLIASGNNGIPNGQYVVLSSTNLTLPLASWTRSQTNSFNGSGGFTFTNAINQAGPNQFFRVLLQ